MSHTSYQSVSHRLQRSELAVPGSNPVMFEKAIKSEADYVFLDLEDSVALSDKLQARKNIIEALNDFDWQRSGKTISFRTNGIDTQYMYRDVIEVVEKAGKHLDTILIPKVGVPADIYMVDALLTQIEKAVGITEPIGIEALIETALGISNVESIASSSRRLEAIHFGSGDFAASCQARTVEIGGLNQDYPGDQLHYAMSRIVVACRAYGLRPIDGPYGAFKDPEGLEAAAKRASALGYEGKWAIHPSQIEFVNSIFSPSSVEVDQAKLILKALEEAAESGKGAASLDGKMIDAVSARMAENLVKKNNEVQSKLSSK